MPWLLVALFFASGCAALIYEVLWFQQLELVLGSSSVSMAVLLAAYMGGMGAGSLWVPSRRFHPLVWYARFELGIAAAALVLLLLLPHLSRAYLSILGHGLPDLLLRAMLALILLLPATFLMGATLPAAARAMDTPRRVGQAYGANLVGAVAGCLVSGFFLLRYYDVRVATLAGVALNLAVAGLAWALSSRWPALPDTEPATPETTDWRPCLSLALSGGCAMACQVIWTRLLSQAFGNTVYTFSSVVALFLTGLGVGAWASGRLRSLAACQLAAGAGVVWAAWAMAAWLPRTDLSPMLRTVVAILPATICWGASFPVALALIGKSRVGQLYASNTLGAILGALAASLVLVPAVGSHMAQQLVVVLSAAAALVALRPFQPPATLGVMVVACLLALQLPPVPETILVSGHYRDLSRQTLFVKEGLNSTVAVTGDDELKEICFRINGRVEASTLPEDCQMQWMLGHIPALVHGSPRSVLVVGCGSAMTAGSFLDHPSVESITIVEMEPLVPQVVAGWFGRYNNQVISDPRVTVVIDDARHYLLTTKQRFDVITSDPIHPWMRGSATLYTQEYFRQASEHLNPGGVVCQWVPLYESSLATVKCELATFFSVFPRGTMWANGRGYDTVLLSEPVEPALAQSRPDFFRYPMGDAAELAEWLKDAELNLDSNLRLQYLAGKNIHMDDGRAIFDAIREAR